MDNSVEYISYNCVLFSYSQGRAESRGIASSVLSKGRQRSGDSRMKNVGGHCRAKEKVVGAT